MSQKDVVTDTEADGVMEREWKRMKREIRMANQVASNAAEASAFRADLQTSVRAVVENCRAARKRKRESALVVDTSDERLFEGARFTDHLPLANYENVLHLVPRLVNIVSLAEAVPMPGSGVKLPLDLHAIGARCSNAYYAPKRFAAVQLAFSNPRCRVLIFHTGRLVGTGQPTFSAAFMRALVAASGILPFQLLGQYASPTSMHTLSMMVRLFLMLFLARHCLPFCTRH